MNILDKEEFRVKLGQINKLVETQDYKGAMQIVDSIDWRRVKNVRTLCVVGEIYAANKRYEESKEIFSSCLPQSADRQEHTLPSDRGFPENGTDQ